MLDQVYSAYKFVNTYTKYLDKVNLLINYQKLKNTDRLLGLFTKAG